MQTKGKYFFTSESVTEGHPDKVADQISDAVLDTLLAQDPNAHVACETLVTTGMAVIAGEITTTGYADLPHVVRETIREIGYTSSDMGFDADTCAVISGLCGAANIPLQTYMNRADLPGGSTVGSMASSLLAMPAADIGVPLLAMHSARELMAAADQDAFVRLCTAFYSAK